MAVAKRCNRCGHKQRNDGTAENPEWVCDRRGCVKYKPPKTEPTIPSGAISRQRISAASQMKDDLDRA